MSVQTYEVAQIVRSIEGRNQFHIVGDPGAAELYDEGTSQVLVMKLGEGWQLVSVVYVEGYFQFWLQRARQLGIGGGATS